MTRTSVWRNQRWNVWWPLRWNVRWSVGRSGTAREKVSYRWAFGNEVMLFYQLLKTPLLPQYLFEDVSFKVICKIIGMINFVINILGETASLEYDLNPSVEIWRLNLLKRVKLRPRGVFSFLLQGRPVEERLKSWDHVAFIFSDACLLHFFFEIAVGLSFAAHAC